MEFNCTWKLNSEEKYKIQHTIRVLMENFPTPRTLSFVFDDDRDDFGDLSDFLDPELFFFDGFKSFCDSVLSSSCFFSESGMMNIVSGLGSSSAFGSFSAVSAVAAARAASRAAFSFFNRSISHWSSHSDRPLLILILLINCDRISDRMRCLLVA